MLGSWAIGVFLRFQSNGPATMQRLASQTALANAQLQRQQGLLSANALALQRYRARMDELYLASQRLGTRVAGGLALAGGAVIAYSLKQAGDLQNAMTSVAATVHASRGDYTRLQSLAIQQSGLLAQNTTTIAQEMHAAAQNAFPRTPDLIKMFPLLARYADVRMMTGHEDPVEALSGASRLAHLMGTYSPAAMSSMLDQLMNMQMVTHATTSAVVNQAKYFASQAVGAGVSTSDIMDQLSMMSMGGYLAGKGGTSLKNFIQALNAAPLITSFGTAVRYGMEHQLGLTDASGKLLPKFRNAAGGLLLDEVMLHLNKMRHSMSMPEFQRDIVGAFGSGNSPYILYATSDAALQQLKITRDARNAVGGVMKVWEQFNDTFLYQWRVFTTNLENIFTALGLPWLGNATNNLKAINAFLTNINTTLTANPGLAKGLGVVIGAFTGLAAIRWSVGSLMMIGRAASALGLIAGVSGGIGGFFRVLDAIITGGVAGRIIVGLGSLAAILGGPATVAIALGLGALATVFLTNTRWWKENGGHLAFTIGYYVGQIGHSLVNGISSMLAGVGNWFSRVVTPGNIFHAITTGDWGIFGVGSLQGLGKFGNFAPGVSAGWSGDNLHSALSKHFPSVKKSGVGIHHTTVHKVDIHVHDAHNPKKVAAAIDHILKNPLGGMYSGDAKIRTHPFIPRVLSTPITLGVG